MIKVQYRVKKNKVQYLVQVKVIIGMPVLFKKIKFKKMFFHLSCSDNILSN